VKDGSKYHILSSQGIQIRNPYSEPFFKENKQDLRKKKINRIINELKYNIK